MAAGGEIFLGTKFEATDLGLTFGDFGQSHDNDVTICLANLVGARHECRVCSSRKHSSALGTAGRGTWAVWFGVAQVVQKF